MPRPQWQHLSAQGAAGRSDAPSALAEYYAAAWEKLAPKWKDPSDQHALAALHPSHLSNFLEESLAGFFELTEGRSISSPEKRAK